jgi:hypothetical protein
MSENKKTTEQEIKKETVVKTPVEKKIEFKNFLENRLIKIVPIETRDFSGQTVESLPEGFIHPNARRSLELHKDPNGRFTQIFNTSNRYLTAEFPEEPLTELEWFSRMIGKDLNVHKKDDNFWAGHMEKGNPTLNYKPYEVTLPREGRTLDLNNLDDYLAYKVLTTNTHRWIAPSWENRYDRPTYWFAMVDEKVAVDRKTEKIKLNLKATEEFNKIKDHRELLMECLIIKDPNNVISSTASSEWLFNQVYEMLENNPKQFLQIVEDPDREEKVMVFKAVRANAIKKSGDKYYTLGDEPLGKLGEVIGILRNPAKIDFRKKVEFQIENHNI